MSKEEFIKELIHLRTALISQSMTYMKNMEEAEDIVQESMMKLFEIRVELDNRNSIKAMAFTITKHLCINRLRYLKKRNYSSYSLAEADHAPTPYETLERKDHAEHIVRIMNLLPSKQQVIVKMRHIEGLSIEEIAEMTGSNAGAVKTNLSRARKKIMSHFQSK